MPIDDLAAKIHFASDIDITCPLYTIGFPGEDDYAKKLAGDISDQNQHIGIIVVPLLDGATATIRVSKTGSADDVVLTFPFAALSTKIRSRLTYKYHGDIARQIRDIDRRRSSGRTNVQISGVFPSDDRVVSCHFHVRHPYLGTPENHQIIILNRYGVIINAQTMIISNIIVKDPQDSNQLIQDIEYAFTKNDTAEPICVYVKPDHHEGNFACISDAMYHGLLNATFDLTKDPYKDDGYGVWFEHHRATREDLDNQRSVIAKWDHQPMISIVTAVYRPPVEYLKAFIRSVLAQSYGNFELILVNVSGDSPETTNTLDSFTDSRIRVITAENKTIADNTNIGIRESHGDYIAFIDHDDTIEPDALYHYVSEIQRRPDADLLYCDEDYLDDGRYCHPIFKPVYNPDMLLSGNYITHMLMVSRHVLDQVDLSPSDVSGAQDYDLTLKCAEKARYIAGIQRVLYHWRMHLNSTSMNLDSKPYAVEAGRIAVQRHFDRIGIDAKVSGDICRYHAQYGLPTSTKVSIIIPVEHSAFAVSKCIESIYQTTTDIEFDVKLVLPNDIDDELKQECLALQENHDSVQILSYPEEDHGITPLLNYGAQHSRSSDLLLFMHANTEFYSSNCVRSMAGYFVRHEVGVVGCKTLYADKLIHEAGMWVSRNQLGCRNEYLAYNDGGYMETLRLTTYNVAAVSNVCQMVRNSLFKELGGFDEQLGTLADVDLCLNASLHGYLTILDPQNIVYDLDRASIIPYDTTAIDEDAQDLERLRFFTRWNKHLTAGRYINRNLDQYNGHYKMVW